MDGCTVCEDGYEPYIGYCRRVCKEEEGEFRKNSDDWSCSTYSADGGNCGGNDA